METTPPGYVGRIPVRNIWLLMLYASDLYRELGSAAQSIEENPDNIPDLIAAMLTNAVESRLKRNLTCSYHRKETVGNRVRGRVNHIRTESRMLLELGKVACTYDDLCVNTPRNRSVRAALLKLAKITRNRILGTKCASLASRLWEAGVTGDSPGRRALSLETFGHHDATDRRMVCLARLAFDLVLPTEERGLHLLASPEREERWLRRLFEKAVGGFFTYSLDRCVWSVRTGERLKWPLARKTVSIDEILPSMQTDVILENRSEEILIIIDMKFTEIVHPGWHRANSLKSGYLYQIYTYLRSQEKTDDAISCSSTGVLLHPAIGENYDESIELQGHTLRFLTVDLAASAQEIRERLLIATIHVEWTSVLPPLKPRI